MYLSNAISQLALFAFGFYISDIFDLQIVVCELLFADIEAQIREIQSKKKEISNNASEKEQQVGLGKTGFYDQDIYDGSNNKFDGYVTSIAANDEIEVLQIKCIFK